MIFLDTSGIYALADIDDAYHQMAIDLLQAAFDSDKSVVLHNYIIVESAALIHRRLGFGISKSFLHDIGAFAIYWVDEYLHQKAVNYLDTTKSTTVSLVDALSFEFMREHQITAFIGFDRHFENEGFLPFHLK